MSGARSSAPAFQDTGQRLAFIWDNGAMKSLETLDGQPCSNKCSRAMSINTRGHVVGFINMLSVGQRAFFW